MLPQESYIRDLDLKFLERRLAHSKKWPEADAKEAVRRYKNFLILICRYPSQMLAPAPDMDEAWHNHILYTKEYCRDSTAIFGDYLHHTPAAPEERARMEEAQNLTAALYQKEFGELYRLEIDITAFW